MRHPTRGLFIFLTTLLFALVSAPPSRGQAPNCTPDDGSGAPVSCEFGGPGTPRPLRTRNPALTPKPRATARPRRDGDRRVRRCQFESAAGAVIFFDQIYIYSQGDWQPFARLPRTQAECIHSPPSGPDADTLRARGRRGGRAGSLGCESNRNDRFVWGVLARVTSRCPVNQTVRAPYPRALVSVPLTVMLRQDEWRPSEAGEWSAPVSMPGLRRFLDSAGNPLVPGIWRDLSLGMRARRLVPGEDWFGARAPLPRWSVGGVVVDAASLITRFERASYGGARLGRGFDLSAGRPAERYDLPAVQVAIETACAHWWALRYDMAAPYPVEDYEGGNCFQAGAVSALGADWHSSWPAARPARSAITNSVQGFSGSSGASTGRRSTCGITGCLSRIACSARRAGAGCLRGWSITIHKTESGCQ